MKTQTNITDDTPDAFAQYSDAELIQLFKKDNDDNAFNALVRRHHRQIKGRFLSKISNASDADDLCQRLWIRVVENIENYNESGRFPHYISMIGSNLLRDYWRDNGVRDAVDVHWPDDDEQLERDLAFSSHEKSADVTVSQQQLVQRLVADFIPNLPVEQRTIYLLRHESEHWESKEPMQWAHIAQLNGIDVDEAWQRFDTVRRAALSPQNEHYIDTEESCVFFVWTQAQRPNKQSSFTESDFAQMLNVPVNTLKSRYRAAVRKLADELTALGATL